MKRFLLYGFLWMFILYLVLYLKYHYFSNEATTSFDILQTDQHHFTSVILRHRNIVVVTPVDDWIHELLLQEHDRPTWYISHFCSLPWFWKIVHEKTYESIDSEIQWNRHDHICFICFSGKVHLDIYLPSSSSFSSKSPSVSFTKIHMSSSQMVFIPFRFSYRVSYLEKDTTTHLTSVAWSSPMTRTIQYLYTLL